MSKTPKTKGKLLCLDKQEKSLAKHPSMKSFFNQVKEKEENLNNNIKNTNIINNPNINIIQIEDEEDEEEKQIIGNNKEKEDIKINVVECEHKLSDGKDNFFVETNKDNIKYNIDNINFVFKRNSNTKPLNYGLSEKQKKLDEKITKQMKQGKDYNIIEKNFDNLLKK